MTETQPVTLRVLGTSVTLLESLRVRAEQDLGIRLVYQVHDVEQAQRIAVMQPDSYDLYDQWFHNVDFVWPAQAIQPIDTRRIALWHEINDLPKRGRLSLATVWAVAACPASVSTCSTTAAWAVRSASASACCPDPQRRQFCLPPGAPAGGLFQRKRELGLVAGASLERAHRLAE